MARRGRAWQQPAKQQQLFSQIARVWVIGKRTPGANSTIAFGHFRLSDAATPGSQLAQCVAGIVIKRGENSAHSGSATQGAAQPLQPLLARATAWQRNPLAARNQTLAQRRKIGKHTCPVIHD